jgi:hypothetical protein
MWKRAESLARKTPAVAVAIDWAKQRPRGNPTFGKDAPTMVSNIHNSNRPAGTTQAAALRRLREYRPDLHKLVFEGELARSQPARKRARQNSPERACHPP